MSHESTKGGPDATRQAYSELGFIGVVEGIHSS